MAAPSWSIECHNPHSYTLTLPQFRSGECQRILFISDEHWDNVHCDRNLLARHLQQALDEGSPVVRAGDTFCAMQGKWDKRADQSQLREEHRGSNYLDDLVTTAVDWYKPYAPAIALSLLGNHETAIIGRHQTNLMERFHAATRQTCKGYKGCVAGYWTFLTIAVRVNASRIISKLAYIHHGYGGGGEVTRGLIDQSRTRSQISAEIFVSGHIHRRNFDENVMLTVDPTYKQLRQTQQIFLRCGTYKDDTKCGWHASKGRASRPLGGWWLTFNHRYEKDINILEMIPIPA
jgi:hypothetical protein